LDKLEEEEMILFKTIFPQTSLPILPHPS